MIKELRIYNDRKYPKYTLIISEVSQILDITALTSFCFWKTMIDCLGNGNYLNVSKSFFFNTKVNAGFKHSKPLENVAPVHHLGIPVAKHMNTFY
jgi:hypothetical protein